jgi:hypothetical protein
MRGARPLRRPVATRMQNTQVITTRQTRTQDMLVPTVLQSCFTQNSGTEYNFI